jgi:cytochrome P450 PksS
MRESMSADLVSSAFNADPYPFYARLRTEAPVQRVMLAGKQPAWLVTRYEDVLTALKGKQFAKDKLNARPLDKSVRQPWVPRVVRPLMRNMLDVDAPDHTRLRTLVHKAFTPRTVEQMRERIRTLTNRLLDAAEDRGRMDLIRDYALPIPTTIIAEMLGVPVEDGPKFHRWSSAIVATNPSRWGMIKAIPNILAFLRYIRRLVKLRRTEPRDDLVSSLVLAEEAGDRLNEDELVAMIFLLLVAGHETTVNLIGNGTLALLEHPDQLKSLRGDPDLIGSAVEELLRYCGPLKIATERYAREDTVINDTTIHRGELVYLALASANRDERQFANPDTLDLTRAPNRHLAFGQGIHFCLGAPLARLEGQIALNTLLQRTQGLRLAVAPAALQWQGGLVMHGLKALPVKFSSVRTSA